MSGISYNIDHRVRTIVLGFEDLGQKLLQEIERECNLKLIKWITFEKWDVEISRCSQIHQLSHEIPRDDRFVSVHNSVLTNISIFVDMFSRHYGNRSRPLHYYLNAFHMFFYAAYKDLTTGTDLAIFSNIPHEGADFIYYLVAKELKIKTIMFHQSLFENRFFYSFSLEDFGYFSKSNAISEKQTWHVERTHRTELFYMKQREADQGNCHHSFGRKISWLATIIKHLRWQPDRLVRGFLRELGYSASFLAREKDYSNSMRSITITQSDLVKHMSSPYIYFPLHLQPELTTSALGDIYSDQLIALEHLCSVLPRNWKILVKENPKQTSCQRDELFFNRLKALRNTSVVPIGTDTFDLISRSTIVATVTGTAGWEAIKGGKPALVFGRPWYMTLPGVFRYEPNIDLAAISNYQIVHERFQQVFANLMTKTGRGVVDPAYNVLVKNYSRESNIKNIAISLNSILKTQINLTPSSSSLNGPKQQGNSL